jgi:lipoprotein-anchoring transpeptidase ErfK/SrfK
VDVVTPDPAPVRSRARRRWLSAAATLLVVVALVVGGVGVWHASRGHRAVSSTVVTTTTVRRVAAAVPARAPGAPPDAIAIVARTPELTVWTSPAGTTVQTRLSNPTVTFSATLVLLVLDAKSHPGWYEVSTPIRPNGTKGWVRASDVGAPVVVPYQITIVQHLHTATLWKSGVKVRTYPVAIGMPATPSPNGLFFVNAILDNRKGDQAYGPWVIGLSGFSNVYQTFNGGDALIGMHGTDEDSTVGTTASHGCFRMHDADATQLAHTVTLGTPVYVSP